MPRTTEEILKDAEANKLKAIQRLAVGTVYYEDFTETEEEKLIAELSALLLEREWQDISTAPKDGNDILVANEDEFQAVAQWWVEGWHTLTHQEVYATHPIPLCFEPTKWQPLPTPPKKET